MVAEREEVLRRHRLEDLDVLDQDALDRVHPLQVVTRALGIPCEEAIADRLQLEQQLLEPELVRLVDHDEQELVVDGGIRQELLEREELRELQVAAVGEEVSTSRSRSSGRIDAAAPPSSPEPSEEPYRALSVPSAEAISWGRLAEGGGAWTTSNEPRTWAGVGRRPRR